MSWGRGAPSRAGKGAGSPVWLRSRPRSDQAPGTGRGSRAPPGSLSHCPARSSTTGARVFDPNRRLWVGGWGGLSAVRVPSGQRAEGRQFRASRRSIGRRAAREEGAPSGPGKALEKEARRRSLEREEPAHRMQPRPTLIPAARLPAPALQAGEPVRTLSPAPGTGRAAHPAWRASSPMPLREIRVPKVTWGGTRSETPEGESCWSP